MAFSAITARGNNTGQASAATITVSPSANLTVGKFVVVTVHCDNTATADGASSTVSSVADNASGSQNVWRKDTERTETDGAANDGSVVAVFSCVIATQIGTGDTITATFASSITARAITVTEATISTGYVTADDVGIGQNSITAASNTVANKEHLFFYAASSEGNDNSKTATTNYTEAHDLRTGNTGDVNISCYVQTRIQTATSSGSVAPSAWATNLTNPISVLVTYSENILRAVPVGSAAVTGLAGALALTMGLSAGSLGLTGPYIGVAFEGPTVGSVDLTGLAPTVSVAESGTTASPPAGSLDLTGRAPSLAFSYAVPAGTLDLTGLAPTSSQNIAAQPPAGSIDLTGLAPSLLANLNRAPDAGTIDLTGHSPALAFVHPIPSGTIDLTGAAPALQVTTLAAPGAGSIDLTGFAPSLAFVHPIPVGTLDLTGLAPGVFSGALITAGAGTLDLTGLTPALVFTVAVPAASLDLTGLAPEALVNQPIATVAGSLDLTGRTPSLAFGVEMPSGTLDLTGLAPSLGGTITASPAAGSLDLAGLTPTPAVNVYVFGQPGTIDLSGAASTLDLAIAIPSGSLGLTGVTPIADAQTDPHELHLSGIYAPTMALSGIVRDLSLSGLYTPSISLTGQAGLD